MEVVDGADHPLLLTPENVVLTQNLPHRQVRVALRDLRGRVLLVRRVCPDGTSGPWSLPGGCVLAGESREGAALRILNHDLGITGVSVLPQGQGLSGENGVTLFRTSSRANLITPRLQDIAEIMPLDKDEIMGLVKHFADLLSPSLKYFAREGYLFPAKKRKHNVFVPSAIQPSTPPDSVS